MGADGKKTDAGRGAAGLASPVAPFRRADLYAERLDRAMGGVRGDGTPLGVEIVVEQDEDGRFAAWSPSLPGCATFAGTREEAAQRARQAVEAYLGDVEGAKRSN